MELSFKDLQTTLLSTVWGVILLGAIGSILGGFIIMLTKKLTINLINSLKNNFPKTRLFYPIYRAAILAQSIKKLKCHEQKESDFVLFAIRQSVMFIAETLLFFFVAFLTLIVIIFFGLERPILLTTLFSLSILTFFNWLKSGVYSLCLISGETYSAQKELDKSIPKKYSTSKEQPAKQA